MGFLQNTYHRHALGVQVGAVGRVTGIDHIADLQRIVFGNVRADYHLHGAVCRKQFTLSNGFSFQKSRCRTDHTVAVIIVCHCKGDHRGDSGILLQAGDHTVGDGAHRFFGKIHGVHGQLGVAAGWTNDGGIVACIVGNTLIHLGGHVEGQHRNTCGDHNRQNDQENLGFLDGHIF